MRTRAILPALCLLAGVIAACGGGSSTEDGLPADEGTGTGGSGTAGKSGAAGATAGKAGSAGATAGAAGTSGAAGTAGTGGNAGAAGSAGGKAGAGGAAAGTGGAAAGTGGAAAGTGGAAAGAAGKGGAAGASGAAGAGGGTGGAAGAGGATAGAGGSAGKGGSAAGAGGASAGAAGSAGSGGTPIVVDCKTTPDCATNPLTKLCDTATSKCVVCLTTPSDTCGANQYCNAGVCASGCKGDSDCSGATPHCDTATHVCKECLTDPQCKAGNICSTAGTCAPGCSAQQPCTDPNASCCGTTCQNTKTDPANCGGCNKPCTPFPNAQTLCNNGGCAMGTCAPGFADCDGNPANGCEVNTALQGACVCKPGVDTKACYYGPAGTQNKGICKGGTVKCAPDGLGFELDCYGQVLPEQETCTDGLDHDCNGVANDVPDVDGDGWNVCNGDCCETITQCGNPKAVNPGAVDVVGDPFPDANCNNVSDPMGASCSTSAKFTGVTGTDMAKAMELCQFTTANPPIAQKTWGVINATQLLADGTTPNATALANIQNYQAAILINYGTGGVLPRKNPTMVGMSSGRMRDQSDPDYVAPNGGTTFTTQVNPPAAYLAAHGNALPSSAGCSGSCPSGSGAFDSVMLRLDIRTPTNAKSFSYDLRFFSSEYWQWQCTAYNDFFLTQLTTGAAGIPADKNISFDNKGNAISVNNGFFESCVVKGCNTCPAGTGALAGTGMQTSSTGGGTTWLTTTAPIVPGETMRLDLAIFDVSDHVLDSLILMDNFQWSTVAVGGPSTGHSP